MKYRQNWNNRVVCCVVRVASPLVRFDVFLFFSSHSEGLSRSSFAVFFALFLKEGILNNIAHDSIIRGFTVPLQRNSIPQDSAPRWLTTIA